MSEEMVLEEAEATTEELPVEESKEETSVEESTEEEVEEEVIFEPFPEGAEVVEETLTDDQAQKLMQDTISGRRYFEVVGVGRLYIRSPNVQEKQEGDFVYAKLFNKAVMEGLDLSSNLEKELIKRGVLEDEYDSNSQIAIARRDLTKYEALLKKYEPTNKSKQVKKLARDIADTRNKIFEIIIQKQNLLSNSAEAKAEEARKNYLISRVTFHADDNKNVWNSYDEYLLEENSLLVSTVDYQFTTFAYGLASDYLMEFPEVKFLMEEDKK
jgi:hypothetical protein